MAPFARVAGPRVGRSLAAVLLCTATVTLLAVPVSAQGRSRGSFFVFTSVECSGGGNAAKVVTPFSVGGRKYPPNTDLSLYATDMATNEVFGPFVVTTDEEGSFCERVNRARATHWKIDLVEPGNGFTDSKVVQVLAPPVTTTTTALTTTTAPGQTTTTTASTTSTSTTSTTTAVTSTTTTSTTLPSTTATTASTTTVPTTTTVPGQTTTTASPGQTTTTVPGQITTTVPGPTTTTATTVPGQTTTTTTVGATTSVPPPEDLGFEVEPVPVPPEGILPATGSSDTSELMAIAIALLATGAAAYFTVRTRRPSATVSRPHRPASPDVSGRSGKSWARRA